MKNPLEDIKELMEEMQNMEKGGEKDSPIEPDKYNVRKVDNVGLEGMVATIDKQGSFENLELRILRTKEAFAMEHLAEFLEDGSLKDLSKTRVTEEVAAISELGTEPNPAITVILGHDIGPSSELITKIPTALAYMLVVRMPAISAVSRDLSTTSAERLVKQMVAFAMDAMPDMIGTLTSALGMVMVATMTQDYDSVETLLRKTILPVIELADLDNLITAIS